MASEPFADVMARLSEHIIADVKYAGTVL